VDCAGWEGVYKILKQHGYNVSIVQNRPVALISPSPLISATAPFSSVSSYSFRSKKRKFSTAPANQVA
jgi:hypothetical protein